MSSLLDVLHKRPPRSQAGGAGGRARARRPSPTGSRQTLAGCARRGTAPRARAGGREPTLTPTLTMRRPALPASDEPASDDQTLPHACADRRHNPGTPLDRSRPGASQRLRSRLLRQRRRPVRQPRRSRAPALHRAHGRGRHRARLCRLPVHRRRRRRVSSRHPASGHATAGTARGCAGRSTGRACSPPSGEARQESDAARRPWMKTATPAARAAAGESRLVRPAGAAGRGAPTRRCTGHPDHPRLDAEPAVRQAARRLRGAAGRRRGARRVPVPRSARRRSGQRRTRCSASPRWPRAAGAWTRRATSIAQVQRLDPKNGTAAAALSALPGGGAAGRHGKRAEGHAARAARRPRRCTLRSACATSPTSAGPTRRRRSSRPSATTRRTPTTPSISP